MTYTYKQAFPTGALGAGNVTIDTVPAGVVHQIRSVTVHNPTAAVIVFTANIVAPAGSSASTNQLIKRSIGVNESYMCPELLNKTLIAGNTVVFNGQNLNAEMSVAEVVQ